MLSFAVTKLTRTNGESILEGFFFMDLPFLKVVQQHEWQGFILETWYS